jgi:hypothetical protein
VIKHCVLRLIPWWNGYTPLNLIEFLDHCARMIFLKKVGGGYTFIHRMLLEYFAELTPEGIRAVGQHRLKVSAAELYPPPLSFSVKLDSKAFRNRFFI